MAPQMLWKPQVEPAFCASMREVVLWKLPFERSNVLVAWGHARPKNRNDKEQRNGCDEEEDAPQCEDVEEGPERPSSFASSTAREVERRVIGKQFVVGAVVSHDAPLSPPGLWRPLR